MLHRLTDELISSKNTASIFSHFFQEHTALVRNFWPYIWLLEEAQDSTTLASIHDMVLRMHNEYEQASEDETNIVSALSQEFQSMSQSISLLLQKRRGVWKGEMDQLQETQEANNLLYSL